MRKYMWNFNNGIRGPKSNCPEDNRASVPHLKYMFSIGINVAMTSTDS